MVVLAPFLFNILYSSARSHLHLVQLYDRDALRAALAGRDIETLRPLISFLSRYLFWPQYFAILYIVTEALLGLLIFLFQLFLRLNNLVINCCVKFLKKFMSRRKLM